MPLGQISIINFKKLFMGNWKGYQKSESLFCIPNNNILHKNCQVGLLQPKSLYSTITSWCFKRRCLGLTPQPKKEKGFFAGPKMNTLVLNNKLIQSTLLAG